MNETYIFDGMSRSEELNLLDFLEVTEKKYHPGEIIMSYSQTPNTVGIIESGHALLYSIDPDGSYNIVERLGPRTSFGEIYNLPINGLEYIIEADSACRIKLIKYRVFIAACKSSARLMTNLFRISAEKAHKQNVRTGILNQRTIRQKLMTYFKYICRETGSNTFELPMTRVELAAYLCADRSAMTREIKNLCDSGIIKITGRKVTVIKTDG